MTSDSVILLRYRREAIATLLKQLDEQATALRLEDAELETAERVLARFEPTPDPGETKEVNASGKPQNTPTTPSMIVTLLKDAERQGKRGLEPKEMLIQITKRWWPSVKSDDVAPTAWRMWKDGRLEKDGSLYMIKKNNEAVSDDLLKN
jgi:hypothetical protein